ncbi:hypothetical protein JX265_005231 [Neoarthrinium moseri]|uniref:Secreted protein n=1 Tax=Neoarthrinium moseri TaxID=1658444 RepID=A0A9Q0AS83_9PEZI|nr:hypothetical protein JX266_008464 [Neoarthrinium moseri]KAI1873609.1 hypothetical protein JX265_005231 [Neoarthrinium moseri]
MKPLTITLGVFTAVLWSFVTGAPTTTAPFDATLHQARHCRGSKVAIAFSNDWTGKYARREICQDNEAVAVSDIYAGSAIDNGDGEFRATSIALVGGLGTHPYCTIQQLDRPLTDRITYIKLGDDPDRLERVDVSDWTIRCAGRSGD